ncbi:MAG: c-type cytochrome, partial [Undibacterium sp.]|nr:c-type cytochrome [Opitutaceae bacterium]
LAAKKTAASVNVRLVSVVALRRQTSPLIAEFLNDPDPLVVEEGARAIHDERGIPAALPQLAALLDRRAPSEVITRRALNANLRLGTPEGAARLLSLGLDATADRAMREEALSALQVWRAPEPLDRVDGFARTFKSAPIAAVLSPKLGDLLALTDPGLKTLAIQIMIAHALRAAPEQIAAIVGEAKAAGELRAQALRLMAGGEQRQHPAFKAALETALAPAAPAPLHRAALELLLPDQPARLVAELQLVLEKRPVPEKQHALALLAKAAQPATDAVLATYAAALVAGTCAPELKLDVIEAVTARGVADAGLAAKAKAYGDSPAAAARNELLAGGSLAAGREVVLNHLNANCLACHGIERNGGSEVGPNLSMIGSQRDPAYLLEALLTPSAKIATGYGIVSVTLKDGTVVSGTLAKETPQAVTVRLFDGASKALARGDIANQTSPVSIMPPMLGVLQPREVRDVVAFLASLKPRGKESAKAEPEGGQ